MRFNAFTAVSLTLIAAINLGSAMTPPAAASTRYCNGPAIDWGLSLWGERRTFTKGLEYVVKTVKEQTCGRFNIKLYYGEELSKARDNLDSIKVGAFESALVCAAFHPQKNPTLNVLDLPFLPLTDMNVMRVVHNKVYAHPAVRNDLAKWNAVFFMSNMLPRYEFMGRGQPPRSISDFKGKRLRTRGRMGDAVKAMGAVPMTIRASEAYAALRRGAIDAVGLPFTYTFATYKLDEIADWYTTNMSLGAASCPVVFNKKMYDKLDKNYRKILDEVKKGAYAAQKAAYDSKDKINFAKWRQNPRIVAVKISRGEMERFRKRAGEPVWEAWVKENETTIPARELLDLVLKTAKNEKEKKRN